MATAKQRGRQVMEARHVERTNDLVQWLEERQGLALQLDHAVAIRAWMRAEWRRGIAYGQHLARKAAR